MTVPDPKEKWSGRVTEVGIGATEADGGTRSRTVTIGGQSGIPFMSFEGDTPHRTAIALDVLDKQPEDWPAPLAEVYGDVWSDPAAWAKKVNLLGKGTTIAHGMCTFSFMTSVVTDWCYSSGAFISGLESKFIEPVRPGDTITCKGVVSEKHPRQKGKSFVVIDLWAENQNGVKVGVAKARVVLP